MLSLVLTLCVLHTCSSSSISETLHDTVDTRGLLSTRGLADNVDTVQSSLTGFPKRPKLVNPIDAALEAAEAAEKAAQEAAQAAAAANPGK